MSLIGLVLPQIYAKVGEGGGKVNLHRRRHYALPVGNRRTGVDQIRRASQTRYFSVLCFEGVGGFLLFPPRSRVFVRPSPSQPLYQVTHPITPTQISSIHQVPKRQTQPMVSLIQSVISPSGI